MNEHHEVLNMRYFKSIFVFFKYYKNFENEFNLCLIIVYLRVINNKTYSIFNRIKLLISVSRIFVLI